MSNKEHYQYLAARGVISEEEMMSRMTMLYRTSPRSFSMEEVDYLEKYNQQVDQAFQRNIEEEDNKILEGINQFVSGIVEGFTTLGWADEPKTQGQALANKIAHFIGFAPDIIAGVLTGGASAGLTAMKLSGKALVKKSSKKALGQTIAVAEAKRRNLQNKIQMLQQRAGVWGKEKIPLLVTEGEKGALALRSVPMRAADYLIGQSKAKLGGLGLSAGKFFGKHQGVAQDILVEKGLHLGVALGVSSIWEGPKAASEAALHGAIAGTVFGGIGNYMNIGKMLSSKDVLIRKNGETMLRSVAGKISRESGEALDFLVKGAAGATYTGSMAKDAPLPDQVYELLLGFFFGASSRPWAEIQRTKLVIENNDVIMKEITPLITKDPETGKPRWDETTGAEVGRREITEKETKELSELQDIKFRIEQRDSGYKFTIGDGPKGEVTLAQKAKDTLLGKWTDKQQKRIEELDRIKRKGKEILKSGDPERIGAIPLDITTFDFYKEAHPLVQKELRNYEGRILEQVFRRNTRVYDEILKELHKEAENNPALKAQLESGDILAQLHAVRNKIIEEVKLENKNEESDGKVRAEGGFTKTTNPDGSIDFSYSGKRVWSKNRIEETKDTLFVYPDILSKDHENSAATEARGLENTHALITGKTKTEAWTDKTLKKNKESIDQDIAAIEKKFKEGEYDIINIMETPWTLVETAPKTAKYLSEKLTKLNRDYRMKAFKVTSGGAKGADSIFGIELQKVGIDIDHLYVKGSKTPEGNKELTKEQAKEADEHILKANETLGKNIDNIIKTDGYVMDLFRRNYFQIKDADQVIAFSVLTPNKKKVLGGTSWAVQMGIDAGKEIIVYDVLNQRWNRWNYEKSKFEPMNEIPRLKRNFAAIGSRKVGEKTESKKNKEGKEIEVPLAPEWALSKDIIKELIEFNFGDPKDPFPELTDKKVARRRIQNNQSYITDINVTEGIETPIEKDSGEELPTESSTKELKGFLQEEAPQIKNNVVRELVKSSVESNNRQEFLDKTKIILNANGIETDLTKPLTKFYNYHGHRLPAHNYSINLVLKLNEDTGQLQVDNQHTQIVKSPPNNRKADIILDRIEPESVTNIRHGKKVSFYIDHIDVIGVKKNQDRDYQKIDIKDRSHYLHPYVIQDIHNKLQKSSVLKKLFPDDIRQGQSILEGAYIYTLPKDKKTMEIRQYAFQHGDKTKVNYILKNDYHPKEGGGIRDKMLYMYETHGGLVEPMSPYLRDAYRTLTGEIVPVPKQGSEHNRQRTVYHGKYKENNIKNLRMLKDQIVSNMIYELQEHNMLPLDLRGVKAKQFTEALEAYYKENPWKDIFGWNKYQGLRRGNGRQLENASILEALGKESLKVMAVEDISIRDIEFIAEQTDSTPGQVKTALNKIAGTDGAMHFTKRFMDILGMDTAIPGRSSIKPYIIKFATENHGLIIAKVGGFRTSPELDAFMEAKGIDILIRRSGLKGTPGVEVGKLDVDKDYNYIEVSPGKIFELMPSDIRIIDSEIERQRKDGTKNLRMQKGVLNRMNRFLGSKFQKEHDKIIDLQKNPDPEFDDKINPETYGRTENETPINKLLKTDKIDSNTIDRISDDTIMRTMKDHAYSDLYRDIIKAILKYDKQKLNISEVYEEATGEKEKQETKLNLIQDTLDKTDYSPQYLNKPDVKPYLAKMVKNYLFARQQRPIVKHGIDYTRIHPHEEILKIKLPILFTEASNDMFFLNNDHKKDPVTMRLKNGKKMEKTLEYLFEQSKRDDISKEQKKLWQEDLEYLITRAPQGGLSGTRNLTFGGFSGIEGRGFIANARVMRDLGGADVDIDAIAGYQSLHPDLKKAFGKDIIKNELVKKDIRNNARFDDGKLKESSDLDKVLNYGFDITGNPTRIGAPKVIGTEAEHRRTSTIFHPWWRFETAREWQKGKDNIGIATNGGILLAHLSNSITESGKPKKWSIGNKDKQELEISDNWTIDHRSEESILSMEKDHPFYLIRTEKDGSILPPLEFLSRANHSMLAAAVDAPNNWITRPAAGLINDIFHATFVVRDVNGKELIPGVNMPWSFSSYRGGKKEQISKDHHFKQKYVPESSQILTKDDRLNDYGIDPKDGSTILPKLIAKHVGLPHANKKAPYNYYYNVKNSKELSQIKELIDTVTENNTPIFERDIAPNEIILRRDISYNDKEVVDQVGPNKNRDLDVLQQFYTRTKKEEKRTEELLAGEYELTPMEWLKASYPKQKWTDKDVSEALKGEKVVRIETGRIFQGEKQYVLEALSPNQLKVLREISKDIAKPKEIAEKEIAEKTTYRKDTPHETYILERDKNHVYLAIESGKNKGNFTILRTPINDIKKIQTYEEPSHALRSWSHLNDTLAQKRDKDSYTAEVMTWDSKDYFHQWGDHRKGLATDWFMKMAEYIESMGPEGLKLEPNILNSIKKDPEQVVNDILDIAADHWKNFPEYRKMIEDGWIQPHSLLIGSTQDIAAGKNRKKVIKNIFDHSILGKKVYQGINDLVNHVNQMTLIRHEVEMIKELLTEYNVSGDMITDKIGEILQMAWQVKQRDQIEFKKGEATGIGLNRKTLADIIQEYKDGNTENYYVNDQGTKVRDSDLGLTTFNFYDKAIETVFRLKPKFKRVGTDIEKDPLSVSRNKITKQIVVDNPIIKDSLERIFDYALLSSSIIGDVHKNRFFHSLEKEELYTSSSPYPSVRTQDFERRNNIYKGKQEDPGGRDKGFMNILDQLSFPYNYNPVVRAEEMLANLDKILLEGGPAEFKNELLQPNRQGKRNIDLLFSYVNIPLLTGGRAIERIPTINPDNIKLFYENSHTFWKELNSKNLPKQLLVNISKHHQNINSPVDRAVLRQYMEEQYEKEIKAVNPLSIENPIILQKKVRIKNVEPGDGKLWSGLKNKRVAARYNPGKHEIYFSKETLKEGFEKKKWKKPDISGVKPIPFDFTSSRQYREFAIFHELSHFLNKKRLGEKEAHYENRMNRIALKSLQHSKKLNKAQLEILEKENFLDWKNKDPADFNMLTMTEAGELSLEFDPRQNTSSAETLIRIRQLEESQKLLDDVVLMTIEKKIENKEDPFAYIPAPKEGPSLKDMSNIEFDNYMDSFEQGIQSRKDVKTPEIPLPPDMAELREIIPDKKPKEVIEKLKKAKREIPRAPENIDEIINEAKEVVKKPNEEVKIEELEQEKKKLLRKEIDQIRLEERIKSAKGKPLISSTEGVNVQRGSKFGNPFVIPSVWKKHSEYYKKEGFVKVKNRKEAIESYDSWVRGTAHKDFLQDKRARIIEALESGELVGKTLRYFKPDAKDSHAVRLAKLVVEMDLTGKDKWISEIDKKKKEMQEIGEAIEEKIEQKIIDEPILKEPVISEIDKEIELEREIIKEVEIEKFEDRPEFLEDEILEPIPRPESEIPVKKDLDKLEKELKSISVKQITERISKILGRDIDKKDIDPEQLKRIQEALEEKVDREFKDGHMAGILSGSPEYLQKYIKVAKDKGIDYAKGELIEQYKDDIDLLESLNLKVKKEIVEGLETVQEIITMDMLEKEAGKHGLHPDTPNYYTAEMKYELEAFVNKLKSNPELIPTLQHEFTGMAAELGIGGKLLVGKAFRDISVDDMIWFGRYIDHAFNPGLSMIDRIKLYANVMGKKFDDVTLGQESAEEAMKKFKGLKGIYHIMFTRHVGSILKRHELLKFEQQNVAVAKEGPDGVPSLKTLIRPTSTLELIRQYVDYGKTINTATLVALKEAYQSSFSFMNTHDKILNSKFDEIFKAAIQLREYGNLEHLRNELPKHGREWYEAQRYLAEIFFRKEGDRTYEVKDPSKEEGQTVSRTARQIADTINENLTDYLHKIDKTFISKGMIEVKNQYGEIISYELDKKGFVGQMIGPDGWLSKGAMSRALSMQTLKGGGTWDKLSRIPGFNELYFLQHHYNIMEQARRKFGKNFKKSAAAARWRDKLLDRFEPKQVNLLIDKNGKPSFYFPHNGMWDITGNQQEVSKALKRNRDSLMMDYLNEEVPLPADIHAMYVRQLPGYETLPKAVDKAMQQWDRNYKESRMMDSATDGANSIYVFNNIAYKKSDMETGQYMSSSLKERAGDFLPHYRMDKRAVEVYTNNIVKNYFDMVIGLKSQMLLDSFERKMALGEHTDAWSGFIRDALINMLGFNTFREIGLHGITKKENILLQKLIDVEGDESKLKLSDKDVASKRFLQQLDDYTAPELEWFKELPEGIRGKELQDEIAAHKMSEMKKLVNPRNINKIKRYGTVYNYFSEEGVVNKIEAFEAKFGAKLFKKKLTRINHKGEEVEIVGQERRNMLGNIAKAFSNMEGKYQLVSLLAHPKTMLTNIYGGITNIFADNSWEIFRQATSQDYLVEKVFNNAQFMWTNPITGKKEPVRIKNMADVEKWVDSLGVLDSMFLQEVGINKDLNSKDSRKFWEEFVNRFTGKLKKERNREDPETYDRLHKATLRELASERGIAEGLIRKGSSFMQRSERYLRRTAFLASYIQAKKNLHPLSKELPFDSPVLIEFAKKGVEASQFMYHSAFRTNYSNTALGRVMTRFHPYGWNSVGRRLRLYKGAYYTAWAENVSATEKAQRQFTADLMAFALGTVFTASLFEYALSPPMNWMQDSAQLLFGDKKTRDRAFFSQWPHPALAPLTPITPPIARFVLQPTTAILNGDIEDLWGYSLATWFPFGRLGRDVYRSFNNPAMTPDYITGLPLHRIHTKRRAYLDRLEDEKEENLEE